MRHRLLKWLLAVSVSMFVLPFGTCLSASIQGMVQSFEPCDTLNCNDPNFFDPCRFLQCERTQRPQTWGGGDE